jgi:hypothetical protein
MFPYGDYRTEMGRETQIFPYGESPFPNRVCFHLGININIFLGGKTCCAFDCTPNDVDTAIEDKIIKRIGKKLR